MKNASDIYMDMIESGQEDEAKFYFYRCLDRMDEDLMLFIEDEELPCSNMRFLSAYCFEHWMEFEEEFVVNPKNEE